MAKSKIPLSKSHPKLVKEWHPTKNSSLKPSDFSAGSNKKVWWKCPRGADHEWQSTISSRAAGTGCPVCRNLKVVHSNALSTTHPTIVSEWHLTKNARLKPEDFTAGSHKKVWWKCPKGPDHIWQVAIYDRSHGSGCPVCRGLKVVKSNSLATTNPRLAKEWHPTKNRKLKPSDFTAGSTKKVWWQHTREGILHEWESVISKRARLGRGCPYCAHQKILPETSLLSTNPRLASEWHPTKNGRLKPTEFSAGSDKKIWWRCPKVADHEWLASIGNRTRGKTSCPFCAGLRVSTANSLFFKYPDLAKELHPKKNGELTPEKVLAGGAKKYYWQCQKDKNHIWFASVRERIRGHLGCPRCSSLMLMRPDLAKEWHKTKNKLTPWNFTPGSNKKVWWKCPKGRDHTWQATISHRTTGQGCPFCRSLKVSITNSLVDLFPEIAVEFHPTRNGSLKAKDVVAGSGKKLWWRCRKNPEHEWIATVANRTKLKYGCPYENGWTLEKIRLFVKSIKDFVITLTAAELYVLFQQNGLLDSRGKAKPFLQALKTGRFPKAELEKFANNEPSLVDELITHSVSTLEEHHELSTVDIQNQELTNDELEKEIEESKKEMPIIETEDVLKSLDSKVFSTADHEAVEFFMTSGIAKIWTHTFKDEKEAIKQARIFKGGKYPEEVKKQFFEEYNGARKLVIPAGFAFKIENRLIEPNLMQRLVAYRIQKYKRQGNWSGTGAGKTLSAIIASRVINSKLTVITCPNSVVLGWKNVIQQAYPDSIVHIKTLEPKINQKDGKHHYVVLNYETFQQENSEALTKQFVDKLKIDFVVIDEIHYSKQRVVEKMSKRKKIISGMLSHATEKNPELHVLGMSATPVINNLIEGKSLLEMISGLQYHDLMINPTVSNCIALYQKLISIGIRWLPNYQQKLNIQRIDVDCSDYLDEISQLGIKHTMHDLEKILTRARLPEIIKNIGPKTLIYTHYIDEIVQTLKRDIEKEGWKVAFFTGEDKSGLSSFIDGDVDVLVASSAIGTGVDGLQTVCNRLIVNILPWTHAEFEQLKGRIFRQGQKAAHVDIIVPITHAEVNGEDWSWCESKWKRIQFKKSLADAAVDGIVPEGHLRTPAQAYADSMSWLARLEKGEVKEVVRTKISIPLSDAVIQKRIRKFGDFSAMNNRINHASSQTTHDRFQKDPTEWEQYHALYREARKEWPIIPYEEMINWFKKRPDKIIGDFGCGEAKIMEALGSERVHSYDHVAINKDVIACDIADVPEDDESLDAVIFSLSLMGANFPDYIKEAHRCLKLDGELHIIETTKRFQDIEGFKQSLTKLGFDIITTEEKYKFTFIRAIKSDRGIKETKLNF